MIGDVNQAVVKLKSELGNVLSQDFSIEDSGTDYSLKIQDADAEIVFSVFPERLNGHNCLTVKSKNHPEFKTSRRLDRPMDRLARKIGRDLLKKSLEQAHLSKAMLPVDQKIEEQQEDLADAVMQSYSRKIKNKIDTEFTMKPIDDSEIQTKINIGIEHSSGKLNIALDLSHVSESQLFGILDLIYGDRDKEPEHS